MSWYYTYYIGYQTPDKKIHPLGPYDAFGELHSVFSHSHHIASELYNDFVKVPDEMFSEELIKDFSYITQHDGFDIGIWYMPASQLGSANYIRTGYYPIDSVLEYQEDSFYDLSYGRVSPEAYAAMAASELKFGPPKPKTNEWGETYTPRAASEYMYFAYPQYDDCIEYETSLLLKAINMLQYAEMPEGSEIAILMTQG